MSCSYKNSLKIQHFRGFIHSSMALIPAHPLCLVSALHSLSSSSHVKGACLHISINPCSLTGTPGQHHNRLCTYFEYNTNKRETDSNKIRNPRFRDKAHDSRSDRANTQRPKYPRKEDKGESQRRPSDKQSSSANSTRDALKTLSKTAVKDRPYPDEQSMPFYPSRGGPGFGSGLNMPTAPWMQEWSNVPAKEFEKKNAGRNKAELDTKNDDMVQTRPFNAGRRISAMNRIVDRVRNLRYVLEAKKERDSNAEIDSPDRKFLPNNSIGSLLEKSWGNMDSVVPEDGQEVANILLPWERGDEDAEEGEAVKEKRVRVPTLAELTIPDTELRRLRTLGIRLKERINVKKAGLTQNILDKIHDSWKTSELVRLKFDEPYLHNMKRAHQLAEDKTGGLVIWRAGSVLVLYRGSNYEPPSIKAAKVQAEISSGVSSLAEDTKPFVPDIVPAKKTADSVIRRKASEILLRDRESDLIDENIHSGRQLGCDIANEAPIVQSTVEMDPQKETNDILDGLGPRFIDWWGNDPLPVDADLLPEVVPNYKTPFRLLPYGTKRSKLNNQELTNLRKLAKPLPVHFALGRNRRLQGLAAAILKIWERCEIAKIAVKRGVQNTNNKIMAEELKKLTGGILLLRNKFFIIIYRGKDFLPPLVATVLAEKAAEAKVHQDEEEIARSEAAAAVQARADVGTSIAGTLAETFEAQAKWMMDSEEQEKMRAAAAEAKRAEAVRRVQRKLAIAQLKKQKAEKDLAKLEVSLAPVEKPADQETLTNEEKFMFRKLGLRMKTFLMLGRRRVFDGVVENMHLHWKHRELVKILSKGIISLAHVEAIARMLEYESGGILVAVEKVSKEYAIIVYRGKNYQRPTKLRPMNLLNKRKALKHSIEIQRQEALSYHISQLEENIKQLTFDLSKTEKVDEDVNTAEANVEVNTKFANLETEDEESDSEPSNSYSENEDTSSEYESEMDAMESVQAETGTEEHMGKELNPIFKV